MAVAARPRLTHDERHEMILAAAGAVFAKHGFHGASTAEIARLADCSEPMLYKHFASKQALFAAVLVDATPQPKARMHSMLEDWDTGLRQTGRLVSRLGNTLVM